MTGIPAAPTPVGSCRVAVVQAAPALFDTPRSLQRLADLTADAARRKAELVVFPEALVGGYPKGHDLPVISRWNSSMPVIQTKTVEPGQQSPGCSDRCSTKPALDT